MSIQSDEEDSTTCSSNSSDEGEYEYVNQLRRHDHDNHQQEENPIYFYPEFYNGNEEQPHQNLENNFNHVANPIFESPQHEEKEPHLNLLYRDINRDELNRSLLVQTEDDDNRNNNSNNIINYNINHERCLNPRPINSPPINEDEAEEEEDEKEEEEPKHGLHSNFISQIRDRWYQQPSGNVNNITQINNFDNLFIHHTTSESFLGRKRERNHENEIEEGGAIDQSDEEEEDGDDDFDEEEEDEEDDDYENGDEYEIEYDEEDEEDESTDC